MRVRHFFPKEDSILALDVRKEIDELQTGHLKLTSCLHFLIQELGGLQVRYLQPVSCWHFKIEITTEIE